MPVLSFITKTEKIYFGVQFAVGLGIILGSWNTQGESKVFKRSSTFDF